MKNYAIKIATCLLFATMFFAINAQEAQAVRPKTVAEREANQAKEVVNKMASLVTLTEEQKTKLQAALIESIKKYDTDRAQVNGDDKKIPPLKTRFVNDMTADLKAVLTADQFATVMKSANK